MATDEPKFETRFRELDAEQLRCLIEKFGSPLHIIDEAGVIKRLQDFQQSITRLYSNSVVAISYKTNPIHALLAQIHKEGAYAEVVSGAELEIARSLGVSDQQIVFNGPVKTELELADACAGNLYLNCDHTEEIYRVEHQAMRLERVRDVGIRISFKDKESWSRFGFEAADKNSEAHEIVSYVSQSKWLNLAGIQIQTGTNIRDMAHFQKASTSIARFVESVRDGYGIELKYLDLGGGLAGISPTIEETDIEVHNLPSVDDYAKSAINPLLNYLESLATPARLLFEPGRTIFEPFGATLMTVVGHRPSRQKNIIGIIVDAGLNVVTGIEKFKHPVLAYAENTEQQLTCVFGSSCRQRDYLRSAVNLPVLKNGEPLIMYGTGAYSMASSHSFISYRPGAVSWNVGGDFSWLRKPDSFSHASELEVMPPGLQ